MRWQTQVTTHLQSLNSQNWKAHAVKRNFTASYIKQRLSFSYLYTNPHESSQRSHSQANWGCSWYVHWGSNFLPIPLLVSSVVVGHIVQTLLLLLLLIDNLVLLLAIIPRERPQSECELSFIPHLWIPDHSYWTCLIYNRLLSRRGRVKSHLTLLTPKSNLAKLSLTPSDK